MRSGARILVYVIKNCNLSHLLQNSSLKYNAKEVIIGKGKQLTARHKTNISRFIVWKCNRFKIIIKVFNLDNFEVCMFASYL